MGTSGVGRDRPAASGWTNTHLCTVMGALCTTVAVAALLLVGFAVLTYMQLNGLEFSRAGFSVVGNRVIQLLSYIVCDYSKVQPVIPLY